MSWQEPGPGKGPGQPLARVGIEAGLRRPQDQTPPPAPSPGGPHWGSGGQTQEGSWAGNPVPPGRLSARLSAPRRGGSCWTAGQVQTALPPGGGLVFRTVHLQKSDGTHPRQDLCEAAFVSRTEPAVPSTCGGAEGRLPAPPGVHPRLGCLPATRSILLYSGRPPASGTSTRTRDVQLSRRSSAPGPCSPTWSNPRPSEPLAACPRLLPGRLGTRRPGGRAGVPWGGDGCWPPGGLSSARSAALGQSTRVSDAAPEGRGKEPGPEVCPTQILGAALQLSGQHLLGS